MTRLFVRFYLGVLAVLFAAWYIHGAVSDTQFDGEYNRVVEGVHLGGVRLVAERLESVATEQRFSELQELQAGFDFPVQIIAQKDLPDDVRQRIAEGADIVSFRLPTGAVCVAGPLKHNEDAVRLGPFPGYTHYEASLRGSMSLAVSSLSAVPADQRDSQLLRLRQQFGYDVQFLLPQELPDHVQNRIAAGDDTVFFVSNEQSFVASPVPGEDNIVRFGPFPNYESAEQRVFATSLALVLLLVAIAIAFLLRPVARQLGLVEDAAHAIATGDLSARVDEDRMKSAKPLAQAFNKMASRTESLVSTQRELLQAVSHELRTPLSRIRFAIDLIETAKDDDERKKRLQSVDTATQELDELVGELLNYVRSETAEQQLNLEPISVRDMVLEAIQRHATLHSKIHFSLSDDTATDDLLLTADAAALRRVLGNLLSNAGRFAKSAVTVSAASADSEVIVDIDDDGPGIPEPDRQRVFEPFTRLDNGDESPGVGLGLALVRRIMERHGGRIEVHESPTGGCRIRTMWPLSNAD